MGRTLSEVCYRIIIYQLQTFLGLWDTRLGTH